MRSHESMYKTDTKNEAKMLRPITKWEAIYGSYKTRNKYC